MWKEINNTAYSGAYQVNGTGTPVILLHGFPENSEVWSQQQNSLQARYCVITQTCRAVAARHLHNH